MKIKSKQLEDSIRTSIIGCTFDGGGSVLEVAAKARISVPFSCTITKVKILADQVGSIVVDVQKDSYANYPPTGADSICAAAKPTLSSASKVEDSTLTGWNKSIIQNDIILFNIDSVSTITQCTVTLEVLKT